MVEATADAAAPVASAVPVDDVAAASVKLDAVTAAVVVGDDKEDVDVVGDVVEMEFFVHVCIDNGGGVGNSPTLAGGGIILLEAAVVELFVFVGKFAGLAVFETLLVELLLLLLLRLVDLSVCGCFSISNRS